MRAMNTLMGKELRDNGLTCLLAVTISVVLMAMGAAGCLIAGISPMSPSMFRYLVTGDVTGTVAWAGLAALIAGVIISARTFGADGARVTGVFMVSRPVSRGVVIIAKIAITLLLTAIVCAIPLLTGLVAQRLGPPLDFGPPSRAALPDLSPGALLASFGYLAGAICLGTMAVSAVSTSVLASALLGSWVAAVACWPNVLFGAVATNAASRLGMPVDTVASAVTGLAGLLAVLYVVYARSPLLEYSTKGIRGALTLLIAPLAVAIVMLIVTGMALHLAPPAG